MDDFFNHLSFPCLLGEMRSYNSAEVPYCRGNAIDQTIFGSVYLVPINIGKKNVSKPQLSHL